MKALFIIVVVGLFITAMSIPDQVNESSHYETKDAVCYKKENT